MKRPLMMTVTLALAVSGLWMFLLAQPTPQPKSDQDKCLTDKDHDACKKYYRLQCINKNADACTSYGKELTKDCGATPGPQTPPPQVSAYLACARIAQCWQNRSIGITVMNQACNADPNSPQCKASRDAFANLTPQACDNPKPPVF
jgi:hypothetical protein